MIIERRRSRRKNRVFNRVCTIVTSYDMMSFIQNGLERKRNDPQQKEIELSLLSD